jgi:hypothetical protein
MVLHGDVFKRAQAEIDEVVGSDRLPDLNDQDVLPYLKCVVFEAIRRVLLLRERVAR